MTNKGISHIGLSTLDWNAHTTVRFYGTAGMVQLSQSEPQRLTRKKAQFERLMPHARLVRKSVRRPTRLSGDGVCRWISCARCSGRACFEWRCRERGADRSWIFPRRSA